MRCRASEFTFPAWSPDGTRIAANGDNAGDVRLYVFDATATGSPEPKLLYDDPGHPPFYLYWSPDGRQIAFLDDRAGRDRAPRRRRPTATPKPRSSAKALRCTGTGWATTTS